MSDAEIACVSLTHSLTAGESGTVGKNSKVISYNIILFACATDFPSNINDIPDTFSELSCGYSACLNQVTLGGIFYVSL